MPSQKTSRPSQGMVDISPKSVTRRVAVASATITLSPSAFLALKSDKAPKGNVLETAKIAGIMAAKATPTIIPLCHPLKLSKVSISFKFKPKAHAVIITSEVVCLERTGVEMEALTAVTAAALTIYDMMKYKDKGMVISDVMLLEKSGGKSGDFLRKK